MNNLIKINYDTEHPTVSARDLHEGLEIGARFNDWFPRMTRKELKHGYFSFRKNRHYRRQVRCK